MGVLQSFDTKLADAGTRLGLRILTSPIIEINDQRVVLGLPRAPGLTHYSRIPTSFDADPAKLVLKLLQERGRRTTFPQQAAPGRARALEALLDERAIAFKTSPLELYTLRELLELAANSGTLAWVRDAAHNLLLYAEVGSGYLVLKALRGVGAGLETGLKDATVDLVHHLFRRKSKSTRAKR